MAFENLIVFHWYILCCSILCCSSLLVQGVTHFCLAKSGGFPENYDAKGKLSLPTQFLLLSLKDASVKTTCKQALMERKTGQAELTAAAVCVLGEGTLEKLLESFQLSDSTLMKPTHTSSARTASSFVLCLACQSCPKPKCPPSC